MNCFLMWWLSVDDFRWRAVLQWNPFVVSLLSNQYFLRELIWELVTFMHYHFWNLFACSLAKCVEVRLFDHENKAGNFFNMTLKNNYYFWILFATKKPFLYIGFSKPFANALVWVLSLTGDATTRNDLWIHFHRIGMSCELSIRPYQHNKVWKEAGNSSPVSVDNWSKMTDGSRLVRPLSTRSHVVKHGVGEVALPFEQMSNLRLQLIDLSRRLEQDVNEDVSDYVALNHLSRLAGSVDLEVLHKVQTSRSSDNCFGRRWA